jgi:hypothetical protein
MARQPDDMVVRILQQIQATLADHGKMHEEHRQAFIRIEHRLDEALAKRSNKLKRRAGRLEQKQLT